MNKSQPTGKLAIILHADVADSTRLVQQDEQLAHERIQSTFRHFSEAIGQFSGHLLELRGDALLAEFERPSDAISATITFQATQSEILAALNDNIKPEIRVSNNWPFQEGYVFHLRSRNLFRNVCRSKLQSWVSRF